MNVDKIDATGRAILLADSFDPSKVSASGYQKYGRGQAKYDVVNAASSSSTPNVKGAGISVIASGNIGTSGNELTFIQTKGDFNSNYNANGFVLQNGNPNDITAYSPNAQYGIDMLSNDGSINVVGLDESNGQMMDACLCNGCKKR